MVVTAPASLRLLAKRINESEGLAAQLVGNMTRAHGALASGSYETARAELELGLRRAQAYGKRR